MRKQDQDDQVQRAKAVLRRVEQESEKVFGAGTRDSNDSKNDYIDVLGKKIGRGIGYVLVIILIWHLSTTYFFN